MASPGFFSRLSLAFAVLFDSELAARVRAPAVAPTAGPSLPASTQAAPERVVEKVVERVVVEKVRVDPEAGALHMLALLQRDGRLVDFLMEEVGGASDADLGAGARVVHTGCRKALKEYVALEPIRTEAEGAPVVVAAGFDAQEVRLSGRVTGEPPFRGTLAHAGWRVTRIALPERAQSVNPRIVAPAEVEL